ncbi:MAG: hypothetical protein WC096_05930, partial [Sphaerochaetaceae bacterium]
NTETKARIAQVKEKIESSMYSRFIRARQLQEYEREESIRQGKIDILTRIANGEEVSPDEFYQTPELFEYAMRMNTQPHISSTVSVRNAENLRSTILKAATAGSYMEAFKNDPSFTLMFEDEEAVTEWGLRDYILHRDDLNPAEKQKLIEQVPMLMEGVNFVRNPDFDAHFENSVGNDLKVFAQSVQGQVLQRMGVNVQGVVQNTYRERLRQEVIAYIEENERLPRGTDRLEIMQRAEDAAHRRLQVFQQNYRQLLQDQAEQMKGEGNQGTAQRDRNNNSEDTFTLPNGVRVKRVE